MIDPASDIRLTFNDYQEDSDISFIKLRVNAAHNWCNQSLARLRLPEDLLVAMIVRGNEIVIPEGSTVLRAGDLLVLAARSFEEREELALQEVVVEHKKQYANHTLSQIPHAHSNRVILIKRGIDTIIPSGDTMIRPGDILVVAQFSSRNR